MSVEISLAAPGGQLTLADLRRLAERCGEFGIPDSSPVRAVVSISGKVKKLTVKEEPFVPKVGALAPMPETSDGPPTDFAG